VFIYVYVLNFVQIKIGEPVMLYFASFYHQQLYHLKIFRYTSFLDDLDTQKSSLNKKMKQRVRLYAVIKDTERSRLAAHRILDERLWVVP
jgi:hypothetical protein